MVVLGVLLIAARAGAEEITVQEVNVARDGATVAVRVMTSGRPRWRSHTWGDPFRVVVDLDGVTYRLPETPAAALVEPVREIRGSQFRTGVARVVIVLEGRADFAVEPDDRGLRVVFTRALAAPMPVSAPRGLVYGIVMREGGGFAYLWDPAKQATAVYKAGDAYAVGVVEVIEERRVIVRGADGPMELRLDDLKP